MIFTLLFVAMHAFGMIVITVFRPMAANLMTKSVIPTIHNSVQKSTFSMAGTLKYKLKNRTERSKKINIVSEGQETGVITPAPENNLRGVVDHPLKKKFLFL
jgi:hypothetical protein